MVKMKKAALGAFGMASLNALGVGSGENGNEAPHQVCNFSVINCVVILNDNPKLLVTSLSEYFFLSQVFQWLKLRCLLSQNIIWTSKAIYRVLILNKQ